MEVLREKNAELSARVSELDTKLFQALLQPHRRAVHEMLAEISSSRSQGTGGEEGESAERDETHGDPPADGAEEAIVTASSGADAGAGGGGPPSATSQGGEQTQGVSLTAGTGGGNPEEEGVRRITTSTRSIQYGRRLPSDASTDLSHPGESTRPGHAYDATPHKDVSELRDVCSNLQHIVDAYEVQFQKMQVSRI